jgi:hypothetical protein
MINKVDKAKAVALEAVVANVKRLLQDARLLQLSGSAGSSLSLSILAFEEAGKGHIIENGWKKPKQISSHSFRHEMAAFVISASFTQKYELDMKGVNRKISDSLAEAGIKPGSKEPLPPMSPKLREELRSELLPQMKDMSDEKIQIFAIEQRWLSKVVKAVQRGNLEKIRQSGLYLDTDAEFSVTSTPDSVERIDAERWFWAATRALNLLENGAYFQDYSPLSELLAAVDKGDKSAGRVLDEVRSMAVKTED